MFQEVKVPRFLDTGTGWWLSNKSLGKYLILGRRIKQLEKVNNRNQNSCLSKFGKTRKQIRVTETAKPTRTEENRKVRT